MKTYTVAKSINKSQLTNKVVASFECIKCFDCLICSTELYHEYVYRHTKTCSRIYNVHIFVRDKTSLIKYTLMSAYNNRNDPVTIDVRTYTARYQNNIVLVPSPGIPAHTTKHIKLRFTAHFGSDSTTTDVQEKTNIAILTRSAAIFLHDSY